MEQKGISLIGMPTSGKTTIGKIVAERLSWPLLDVDKWMEQQEGMPLADVIETKGVDYTLDLETHCLQNTILYETVVSTPGSILYNHVLGTLQAQTEIVWLDVPYKEIERRLATDPNPNRINTIIGVKEKGLERLYNERVPLYKKWAKFVIDCTAKDSFEIATEVISITGGQDAHDTYRYLR